MELAALATLWKYIGEMMEIDYAEQLGKGEWKDGIEFMADVTRWALGYEDNHMRPVLEVQHMGKMLVDLLVCAYPKAMRPLGYQMLRMRYAFGYVLDRPVPPFSIRPNISTALWSPGSQSRPSPT